MMEKKRSYVFGGSIGGIVDGLGVGKIWFWLGGCGFRGGLKCR